MLRSDDLLERTHSIIKLENMCQVIPDLFKAMYLMET